jgi:hypothetical protein
MQSANFFSKAYALEKKPELRHGCAPNRARATLFRSKISAPRAVLAQISPGHDCRVVVRDTSETRTVSHVFFVILHCNVDRHRQFDSRPAGGLTACKLFSARDAPLPIRIRRRPVKSAIGSKADKTYSVRALPLLTP